MHSYSIIAKQEVGLCPSIIEIFDDSDSSWYWRAMSLKPGVAASSCCSWRRQLIIPDSEMRLLRVIDLIDSSISSDVLAFQNSFVQWLLPETNKPLNPLFGTRCIPKLITVRLFGPLLFHPELFHFVNVHLKNLVVVLIPLRRGHYSPLPFGTEQHHSLLQVLSPLRHGAVSYTHLTLPTKRIV